MERACIMVCHLLLVKTTVDIYYRPPNDDPRMGQFLAKHVLNNVLVTGK